MASWIKRKIGSFRAGMYINRANKQVHEMVTSGRAMVRVLMPLSLDLNESRSLSRVIDNLEEADQDDALNALQRMEQITSKAPSYENQILNLLSPDISVSEKKQLVAFFMFNRISLNIWLATISAAVSPAKVKSVYDAWDLLNSADSEFDQAIHDVRAVNEYIAVRLGRPFHAWIDNIDAIGQGWHAACQWHPRDEERRTRERANK